MHHEKIALLAIDVQATFRPPRWLIDGINDLARGIPSAATIELHDETRVPFQRQLGWAPAGNDDSLVDVDRVFVKYGFSPSPETIAHLRSLAVTRVLVCGIQADTCVLAAGFALFDAGLTPTLIVDLVVGSSLDRGGELGVRLWRHHFRHTTTLNAVRSDRLD
jgi:nicotinamidase-related amidase